MNLKKKRSVFHSFRSPPLLSNGLNYILLLSDNVQKEEMIMSRGGGSGGGSHGGGGGHFHYGNSRGGGRTSSGSNYRSGGTHYYNSHTHYIAMSPMSTLITVILTFIVVVGMLLAARPNVQTSTIERTKLESTLCTKVDVWYQDDIGWIHDEKTLLKGLKAFYDKTGVQPYLWITDNINGKTKPTSSDFESMLQQKYQELFDDEGHLIVCFMESSSSVYATYYWAGSAAKGVIDDEAGEILLDVIDSKYTSSLSDEEMFAKSFNDAAERMMKVGRTTKQYILIAVAVVTSLGIIVGFIVLINAKRKADAQEAKETQKILNTSVEEMADSVLNQYDKEN